MSKEHPAEKDALTEAERDALACRCHESICPIHNEASDGYVEHEADALIAVVERIVTAHMAKAWDSGYYNGAADERQDPGGKSKTPNPHRARPTPPEVGQE